jgi:hypothetical protein
MRPRPLATIGIVVLVSATFAPAAAAVDTDIAISTTAVDFGFVEVGDTKQVPVTLTNTGGDSFTPHLFGGAPPTPEFNASQNCQLVPLPPGGSCQITYSFSPGAKGTYSDTSSFTVSETDQSGRRRGFRGLTDGTRWGPSPPEPHLGAARQPYRQGQALGRR